MATKVAVQRLQAKSHSTPDELRTPDKTRVEVVEVAGYTIGRTVFQPGWRWSECIKPVVKTDSCQLSHVGYCVAGGMTVRTNDGEEAQVSAGSSYAIPPGHDAWVGDEGFTGIEVLSADQFAKPPS